LPDPAKINEVALQLPASLGHAHVSSGNCRPVRDRAPIGSHEASYSSRSSGSTRSNMNSSESSFQFPFGSADDPWRSPNHAPISLGAVALPPLMALERAPDVAQDQSQRFLPMPTPTPAASPDNYHGLKGVGRVSTTAAPRQQDVPGLGLSLRLGQENKSPLDRSESEAADALAGLASGTRSRHFDGRGESRRVS